MHADVRAQHAAGDLAARDDAARRDDRVQRHPAPVVVVEHELRRRRLFHVRAQRPLRVVQVELRVDVAEVHVRLVVGVDGADVAPVLRRLLVLVVERVRVDRLAREHARDDVLAEVVMRVVPRVFLERRNQRLGLEHVDAHGRQARVGRAGHRRRLARLLVEADHPVLIVHRQDPEPVGVGNRDLQRRQGRRRLPLDVELEHPGVVHLVDVVARQDDDVARPLTLEGVEVLVDRVGRPQVPVVADPLLRRQDLDELAQLFGDDVPALPDVPVERERLVLRGDENPAQAGVYAVAEGEIDDPVGPAKVHRRLGAFLGERIEPLAHAARQHDDEGVFQHRRLRPVRTGPTRRQARDRNHTTQGPLRPCYSLTCRPPRTYDRPSRQRCPGPLSAGPNDRLPQVCHRGSRRRDFRRGGRCTRQEGQGRQPGADRGPHPCLGGDGPRDGRDRRHPERLRHVDLRRLERRDRH